VGGEVVGYLVMVVLLFGIVGLVAVSELIRKFEAIHDQHRRDLLRLLGKPEDDEKESS